MRYAKAILANKEPDIALLNYRSTVHSATRTSPAEALMGRRLRTRLPVLNKLLFPKQPDDSEIRHSDQAAKDQYKAAYDKRHGARPLAPLQPGQPVLLKLDGERKWTKPGMVHESDGEWRTYLVETPSGILRRNRKHLQHVPVPVQYQRMAAPWPEEDVFEPPPTAAPLVQVPPLASPGPASPGAGPPAERSTPAQPRRASERVRHRPQRLIEQS